MAITAKEEEHTNDQQTWKDVCIKDVCESITDCVNKTAPTVDYPTSYIMIRTNNVRNGHINLSDVKYVTKEIFEIWTRRIAPQKGDIILTREAPLGEVGMITTDDPIFLGQRLMQYRTNPCYLDNRFLLYTFQEHAFQEQIKLLGSGATVEHMRVPDAEKLILQLPSLPEQRAIATALSDVDTLITSLNKLIAKKRDIKQATMQQLLTGKMRLPGFSGKWHPFKMADDSTLKARIGWQGLTTTEYLKEGKYYLITGTDFIDGKIDWNKCHFVDAKRYEQDRNIQLHVGDVLLTKDGTIGKVAYVDHLPGPATLNSGVFVIRPKDSNYYPPYLYYVLSSNLFDAFLKQLKAGSTISHLYQKDFVGFNFLSPSWEEQQAIATILSDMDAEIAALEQKRDKIRVLKQGMMQELLTGKTRLL